MYNLTASLFKLLLGVVDVSILLGGGKAEITYDSWRALIGICPLEYQITSLDKKGFVLGIFVKIMGYFVLPWRVFIARLLF